MQAPELAALALLERALEISVRALMAEHPTLDELAEPDAEPASLRHARRVLARISPLRRDVRRYRAAVLAAIQSALEVDDDDLPF